MKLRLKKLGAKSSKKSALKKAPAKSVKLAAKSKRPMSDEDDEDEDRPAKSSKKLKSKDKAVKSGKSEKASSKIANLPAELEDTKKVGTNIRVKYDDIDGDDYLIIYVKTNVRGEVSSTGRSNIIGKTERFAKLDQDMAMNLVITKKATKKKVRKRDDDDE